MANDHITVFTVRLWTDNRMNETKMKNKKLLNTTNNRNESEKTQNNHCNL